MKHFLLKEPFFSGLAVYNGRETTEAVVFRDGEQKHDRVLAQSQGGTDDQKPKTSKT